MTWTVVPDGIDATCGACGKRLKPGDTLAFLTVLRLPRCVFCAGEPVDIHAVKTARAKLEADRNRAVNPTSLTTRDAPPPVERRPVPVRDLVNTFDPKAAAANDRD